MFFHVFIFLSLDVKKKKNRREVPIVKMTIFLHENSISGPRWTVGSGPFEGLPRFHVFHLSFSFFLFPSFEKCFFIFLSNICRCWHEYQILTFDVSSIVGAPWRCAVLTAQGGIAGLGWATCCGQTMIQLPGVGWKLLTCQSGASPDWITIVVSVAR